MDRHQGTCLRESLSLPRELADEEDWRRREKLINTRARDCTFNILRRVYYAVTRLNNNVRLYISSSMCFGVCEQSINLLFDLYYTNFSKVEDIVNITAADNVEKIAGREGEEVINKIDLSLHILTVTGVAWMQERQHLDLPFFA